MGRQKEFKENEVTFNLLVRENHQKIYCLLRKMVRSHEEADDLTQETFLKVYKNLSKFRNQSQPGTWIYRIAVNTAINYLRREKLHQFLSLESANSVREEMSNHPSEESREILRRAVGKLPPRQQVAVMLRIYQELSFREIAAIMECTENAAKVNFSHAVNNLRLSLRKAGVNFESM
ncbi:MAG: RNA polymerase sigma factor [Candidatus Marinimicrobia bacterium]|nr:RNA polymerase sigma factor [Candidatus Neomarinimicrobiota bacterium]